jgi:hypothetical protein
LQTPSSIRELFAKQGWVVEHIDLNGNGGFRVWVPDAYNIDLISRVVTPLVRAIHIARINDRWSIALTP